jgi:hypothetical protein
MAERFTTIGGNRASKTGQCENLWKITERESPDMGRYIQPGRGSKIKDISGNRKGNGGTMGREIMNDELATTADLRDLRRFIHEVTGYRLLTRSEVHQIAIILEHAVDRELAKAVMEQDGGKE